MGRLTVVMCLHLKDWDFWSQKFIYATWHPKSFRVLHPCRNKVIYSSSDQDSDVDHILWRKYFFFFPADLLLWLNSP